MTWNLLFKLVLISGHGEPGFFWLRVLDVGIAVKDLRRHPALFSERNGLSWWYPISKNWRIKPLLPNFLCKGASYG